jgi:hypothetical protein
MILECKVCILNARSVSTESRIGSEKFKENQGNSDQVQGVHNVKNPTSFEEPMQRNARWARRILFSRKSFELSYSKSQECKVCVGDRNPLKGRSSEDITLFMSVDKIPEFGFVGRTKVQNL